MAYEVHWTPARAEEFIQLACLNGEKAAIIRLRPYRYSRVKDTFLLSEAGYAMSLDSYDKHIRELKDLYDAVQPEAKLLPPRQHTKHAALTMAGYKKL